MGAMDRVCCRPKIASLIVGYIAAVDALFIAVKCFAGYAHEMITLITLTKGTAPRAEQFSILNSICTARGVFNCVLFLFCILMIYGIYYDSLSFILPWLVAYVVVIMLDVVLLITALLWAGGVYLLFYIIFIGLRVLALMIVFKYYTVASHGYRLQEEEEEEEELET